MDKSFFKNVGIIGSSTVLVQLISIITVPILTRIYSPADLGFYTTAISISYIFIGVASLRYEQAIMLPEKFEDSINLAKISLFFALVLSALIFFISYFITDSTFVYKIFEDRTYLLFAIPVLIIVIKSNEVFHLLLNKLAKFKSNSVINIGGSIFNRVNSILFGYIGYNNPFTLIVVHLLGEFLMAVTKMTRVKLIKEFFKINLLEIKRLLLENKKFPLYDVWSTFFNTLSTQLIPVILAFFTTASVVGYYSQGLKLIQLPLIFIGGAVSQVFYQKAVEYFNQEKDLNTLFRQTFLVLFVAGLFPALLVLIAGDILMPIVLGSEWLEAGVIAQILMPWVFVRFLGSTLSTLFLVHGKQKLLLRFSTIAMLSRLSLLYVMFQTFQLNYRIVLLSFSILGLLLYVYMIFLLFKISNEKFYAVFKDLKRQFLYALLFIGPIILLRVLIEKEIILFIFIIIASLGYYFYLIRFNDVGKKLIKIIK
ncbi:lipopolysaccharide biosynthesis protein [Winogradskyella sp.]|uniref:lipopolysaccharide biosynthesis protein n=1 Tax=Winogradskyella sp. TaxID=1883156 RepID=UPI00262A9DC3|nr:oligosaccharide flippase family protein [Winogradskyella sp.]